MDASHIGSDDIENTAAAQMKVSDLTDEEVEAVFNIIVAAIEAEQDFFRSTD